MTVPNPHITRLRSLIDNYMSIHSRKKTVRILDSALRKQDVSAALLAYYTGQKLFVKIEAAPGKTAITVSWK